MLNTLMYHDIRPEGAANRYSFTMKEFGEHLDAIKAAVPGAPAVLGRGGELSGFALTFDDGAPGWLPAAQALLELRWRAFFFVVTGVLGKAGKLTGRDLRRLDAMGHVIGTHSVDHPILLGRMGYPVILEQWSRSKAALEDILGREVTSASLPGGFYSAEAARAAEAAGLDHLFTSEPVSRSWRVGRCRVLGRFALTRGMSGRKVARLAAGAPLERAGQYLAWNAKKAAKSALLYFAQSSRKA